jgi:hypothetical protein
MKSVLKVSLIVLVVIFSGLTTMAKDKPKEVEPGSAKNKNLFVFKAEKKFVGAMVEIIQANGNVISEQLLMKRKMIIDFDNMKDEAYTIRLKKGDAIKEFQFKKKNS